MEQILRAQLMYNLTVAQAHTFFVGIQQWLVHNSCPLFDAEGIPYKEGKFDTTLQDRGISEKRALDVYNNGRLYEDARGSQIRYKNRIAVVVDPSDGMAITAWKIDHPSREWKPWPH